MEDETRRRFLAFREECIWLRCCYNTYTTLYESGSDVLQTLSKTASIFFHDFNMILIDYCILLICRITDPAKSFGRDNLTVQHLNSLLRERGVFNDEICRYSKDLHAYREKVKPVRDRLIAHRDADSVMNGKPLGNHEKEDVEKFFDSLQEYADAVGNAIGEGPLDFRTIPGPGDAIDLIRKLRGQI